MAESKNASIPPKTDNSLPVAERRDRAHGNLGNQPHVKFGQTTTKSSEVTGTDPLPPKLQARMERLMADLAALEEPDFFVPQPGDLMEVPAEPSGKGDRQEIAVRTDRQHLEESGPGVIETSAAVDPPATVPFRPAEVAIETSLHNQSPIEPMLESPLVGLNDLPSLTDVSTSFSRQAREILEILKRRQDELSLQKNELELREAAMEKRIRQERLALVERQRQLEQSLALHEPMARPSEVATRQDLPAPEWIAASARLEGGSMANQDGNFYAVIEEFVARQVRQENEQTSILSPTAGSVAPMVQGNADAAQVQPQVAMHKLPESSASDALQHQAQQLRQQHETAIRSLRQTRRQLELLKDILAQQQAQWGQQLAEAELCRVQAHEAHTAQQQNWLAGLEDIERLRDIERNETAKQKTFLNQREASLVAMEERLQQAQVEILRDRVVLKQLERTVRQSMSNADWNQRWQVISEETQSYLKKVHEEAAAIQSDTKRKLERMESRKSELLLYRESLRNWIERQMKLISRRVAHSDDRETQIQQLSETLLTHRRDLEAQQDALNELFGQSLQVIDARLNAASLPNQEAA